MMDHKQNQETLNACARHRFDPEEQSWEPPLPISFALSCRHCGGIMRGHRVLDYVQGYQAAGGNPNDVFPGFLPEAG